MRPRRSENLPRRAQPLFTGAALVTTVAAASGAHAQTAQDQTATPPANPAQTSANGLQEVTITAQRTGLNALPYKIQDTPQSIDVVTKQILNDQNKGSLQDALRNVPGITLNSGEGGTHGDNVNLRGFSATDDFFLDGVRDTGFYDRDIFNLESVQVLEGPASTLFGRGSTGGVINQVSKMPTLAPKRELSTTFGTNDEQRGTADFNQPISDTAAIRLNLMGQHSGVAQRDYTENNRFGFAPSISVGIGEPTTVTLAYFHQEEDNIPDYGIPFLPSGHPAPVPRTFYYGLPADDRVQTNVNIMTAQLKHSFTDALSFSDTFRYSNNWYNSRETAPHYGGAANEVPAPTIATPLANILVLRDRPSLQGTDTNITNQAALNYKFSTGSIGHTLIAGIESARETSDLTRFANQIDQIAPVPLLAPNAQEAFPGHQYAVTGRPSVTGDTFGIYLLDIIHITPQWDLTGAVRYDEFDASSTDSVAKTHFSRTDTETSPRAALVYKATDTQSYYVSYGTSFNPSAENLSLSSSNSSLAPEEDRTFEAGAKIAWLDGRLATTAAIFNTEMTNARVADITNPKLQELAGDLRVNGIELGASGYITDQWEILAGMDVLDPKTTASTAPTQVGKLLQNTPRVAANIWVEYNLDDQWEFGTGLNYEGMRYADPNGLYILPSYTLWNGMVSYRVNDTYKLQVNIDNITDEFYYDNSYYSSTVENHVLPGAGRTVSFTATADF